MLSRTFILTWSLTILALWSQAQDSLKWWNPADSEFQVIEGQSWYGNTQKPYDRFPAKAEKIVRPQVWNLSRNSTGLMIRFRSDAQNIQIRYKVAGQLGFPHMPPTGVSGVDLYAVSADGDMLWCQGKYSFKDTVSYQYNHLTTNDVYHKKGREYRLFLPLYNSVEWMEIGVSEENQFVPLPIRNDLPLVVYGTSIAQGACANRPGMAWTGILGRKMDRPVVNLGFSGNGPMEKEVIELLAEVEAKAYILDCLPNMTDATKLSLSDIRERTLFAGRYLRKKRPKTPIVFAEHAGYTEGRMNKVRQSAYENVNQAFREAFAQLKTEGISELYVVPITAFDLDIETTVDGTHPNDLGMYRYALGYEKYLRAILHEESGKYSTQKPVIQSREMGGYSWEERHHAILELNKKNPPKTVLFGNSITHFWGGEPSGYHAYGKDSWDDTFRNKSARNFGFGWDRIENVLWRVHHGELDGYKAEHIFVMIGTNNFQINTNEEIVQGWATLIKAIRQRQPAARLTMVGIYPRRDQEDRVNILNDRLAALTGEHNVQFANPGKVLLQADQKIDEKLFSDGLHPNTEGYRKLGTIFKTLLVN